ncbi:MAG: hypothetical protein QNL18_09215, partial [Pseudomonadales bacterium]
MQRISSVLLFGLLGLTACDSPEQLNTITLAPPVADQKETWIGTGAQRRRDEYYWIRGDDRSDPKV